MDYRLIALDVDGTLLNDHHELTERTKQTVRKINDAGAAIVLCTGRSPVSTLPILQQLGLEGTIITHNGAATIRSSDREIIHHYPFAAEQLSQLVNYCRDRRIHMDICTPFHLHVEADLHEETAGMYEKFLIEPIRVDNLLQLSEAPVKFTVFGGKAEMDVVEQDWRSMSLPLSIIRSGDYFIDVMDPLATKGSALKMLSESLGIDRSQVMAIGNYYNDVDMLRFAGLGIAMDNSPDEVKREADAVTASNNEDGVHKALSRYALQIV